VNGGHLWTRFTFVGAYYQHWMVEDHKPYHACMTIPTYRGPQALLDQLAYPFRSPKPDEEPSGPLASALAHLRRSVETGEPWIVAQRVTYGFRPPNKGGTGYNEAIVSISPTSWALGVQVDHDPHVGTGVDMYAHRTSVSLSLGPLYLTFVREWGVK
jgi:hypothetical protein